MVLPNKSTVKLLFLLPLLAIISCTDPDIPNNTVIDESINNLMSESDIADLARDMSESLRGRSIANNDIRILNIYSIGRTLICYYDVPIEMELDQSDVKSQRVDQLRSAGFAETFIQNEINFEMWFHKNDEMYMKVRINYQDLI